MLVFTVEELENRGIPYKQKSQFTYNGKQFTKSTSFSHSVRQTALDLYKSYLNSGVFCMLVESPDYLTICRQR
jgi:hypothetical protein